MQLKLMPPEISEEIACWLLPDIRAVARVAVTCKALYEVYNCIVHRAVPVKAFPTLALTHNTFGPHPATFVRSILFEPSIGASRLSTEMTGDFVKGWEQLDCVHGLKTIRYFAWAFVSSLNVGFAACRPNCLNNLSSLRIDVYTYDNDNFTILVKPNCMFRGLLLTSQQKFLLKPGVMDLELRFWGTFQGK